MFFFLVWSGLVHYLCDRFDSGCTRPSLPLEVILTPVCPRSTPCSPKPRREKVNNTLLLEKSIFYPSTSLITPTGITYEELGKIIGKDEVWVASAFFGQVSFRFYSFERFRSTKHTHAHVHRPSSRQKKSTSSPLH